MKRDRPSISSMLRRCLGLRCPACGQSTIVQSPFKIGDQCPVCGAHFKREEGFFVGAISVNVVTTEVVILVLYLVSMPLISNYYQFVLGLLFAVALLFPLAFYHHSWSVWLSVDHFIEGLPRSDVHVSGQMKSIGSNNGGT